MRFILHIKKQKQNNTEQNIKEFTKLDIEVDIAESQINPQEDIKQKAKQPPSEEEIDLFDIENVDFAQRQERRRGSRRRGYRRIDDRNLVSRAQEESENIIDSIFSNERSESNERLPNL